MTSNPMQSETYVCPGFQGGANWYSTIVKNPTTGLYYFFCIGTLQSFTKRSMEWEAGKGYMGGAARPAPGENFVKSVRAINIQTGEIAWDLPQISAPATASSGLLSTPPHSLLWRERRFVHGGRRFIRQDPLGLPGQLSLEVSPMTYVFDNKQYIVMPVGQSIVAFGLPE
jgi:hypothetical protein